MNPSPPARAGAALRGATAWLRSGRVILSVLGAIGAAAALAALLPQEPDAPAIARFAAREPALARLTEALGLHRVTTSPGFLLLVVLALACLAVVQVDQWRRVRRTWRAPLAPGALRAAQFRRERPVGQGRAAPSSPRLATSGKVGALGSPVFHLGLLLVVLAGLGRLLFFREALVRLVEGETLEPAPGAYVLQRGGALSRPFALARPVRLEAVRETRYESGALLQLAADVTLLGGAAPEARRVGINAPLDVGMERLYVDAAHGLAAVFELRSGDRAERATVLLEPRGDGMKGRLALGAGGEVRLDARTPDPTSPLEVRILQDGALLALAELAPGDVLPLAGGGEALRLVALPRWVELRGSRDPFRPLFFVALGVGMLGVALMLGFVRVDSGVFVEGDRLVVALRAQRFAPLFAERFEALCKEWET